jgi:hypothetical protein
MLGGALRPLHHRLQAAKTKGLASAASLSWAPTTSRCAPKASRMYALCVRYLQAARFIQYEPASASDYLCVCACVRTGCTG